MRLEEFNYHLPKELIAQFPSKKRDESRLMVINRKDGTIAHRIFYEVIDYLQKGDILVLNNTKVIPARLFGKKRTGGAVEVLLIQRLEALPSQLWSCLISPARRMRKGSEILFEQGLRGMVLDRGVDGNWIIELLGENIDAAVEGTGRMPLPPYIKRDSEDNTLMPLDKERYQTVFAKESGAIAAPTAGLHFTDDLLKRIHGMGVDIFYITLHTGLGTFKPVKEDDITKHRMMPEYYKIDNSVFNAIKNGKLENRRIIAVGSTATRALETMVREGWEKPLLSGHTDLFIYPGFEFRVVDALITNFHLPNSTLLMMVAAFAGKDFMMRAYEEAVRSGYRFFSYGDAMMIY